MEKLYILKDKMKTALDEYAGRNTFSPADIEAVKNALSAIFKICDYIEMEEGGEYSRRSYRGGMSYGNPMSYGDNSYRGESYGDESYRGRNRDSMGRYTSESRNYSRGDVMEHLEEMAHNEPDERKRREYMEFIDKMKRY